MQRKIYPGNHKIKGYYKNVNIRKAKMRVTVLKIEAVITAMRQVKTAMKKFIHLVLLIHNVLATNELKEKGVSIIDNSTI